MRFFVVLATLLSISCALPQYNYQLNGYGQPGELLNSASSVRQGGEKYLPPATTTEGPLIHKQFYVITPQEDASSQPRAKKLVLGRPQKNYRVVFIKAPSQDNVKYTAEVAPKEEKTVIYVLSKKKDDLDEVHIATPAPTQPSQPEVFFIKYKTDEEAVYAQHEIQGQYDVLGGTDEYHGEGSAPVTSIDGSLNSLKPDGSYDYKVTKDVNRIAPGRSNPIDNVAHASDVINAKYLPGLKK